MPRYSALLSPLARGAYFGDTLAVARAELEAHALAAEHRSVGPFDFFDVSTTDPALLARLSFIHGLFQNREPLTVQPGFNLPEDLVFGQKYPGKTHEIVTQLAINLALRFAKPGAKTLLDPMAGRGTTLAWALRYGLNARGIEKDGSALDAFHAHVKKTTKLHRLKHKHDGGHVGKKGFGRFTRYTFGESTMQLINGGTRDAETLVGRQRFDLIVCDLPYGIRFSREHLDEVAEPWSARLKDTGAMVLIFNRYQPSRKALTELFAPCGLIATPFAAPHRMSESIVRDLIVFTRQPT
ncbi:MAG: hypothetical protein AAF654_07695 [Myxococcota bacterium]